jgi:uncharacterized lipoprotein YddW (UPF0748 family)
MVGAVVRFAIATVFLVVFAAIAPLCNLFLSATPLSSPTPIDAREVRALWVVRTSMTSPSAIATMVSSAKAGGFNTLLVQIRGRGDAYYRGGVEPRPASLSSQPSFDPLATAIARAHEAGLRVHGWVNVNLVGGLDLPSSRDHVMYRHPEWLMVPRPIAMDLARIAPTNVEYVKRIARYARDRSHEIEGVYLSPVLPASADYTVGVVRDIAGRYAVDGVHLDYIRYPDEDFDYGRETLAAFRARLADQSKLAEFRGRDAGLISSPRRDDRRFEDLLADTRAFPDEWRTFRADRLTSLVVRLREAVREVRPSAVVSAAVVPDPDDAALHRLQNWPAWTAGDLVDAVCPMAYTMDAAVFAAQIAMAKQAAGSHAVWAGIGAYRLSPVQILDNVQAARRLGAGGVVLFSYDSLADSSRGPGFLAHVGRTLFSRP